MPKNKKNKVKKGDHVRVLLTETAPFEVPIMFSNNGFYNHSVLFSLDESSKKYPLYKLFLKLIHENNKPTTPHSYGIRKDEIALRTLSLIHPASQYRFIPFYKKYGELICYFSSKSPISIRYPQKIGTEFYTPNSNQNINKYKASVISTTHNERFIKHPATYFTYGGYDRAYKFFQSDTFLELEKSFSHFWQLDVSKCFDSIYTHTIAWALKSKEFAKDNLKRRTFGEEFDTIIRMAKDNESNGIIIGPEISRIFAEIVFQAIDKNIIEHLKSENLVFGSHYSIRRYVDDIYLFTKDERDSQKIAQVISIELFKFNLHLNEGKQDKIKRPFLTRKSRVVQQTDHQIREFVKKFSSPTKSEKNNNDEYEQIFPIPEKIYHLNKLRNSFINGIKAISSANEAEYSMASNYIISSLSRRVSELIEGSNKQLKKDKDLAIHYYTSILCFLEAIFFFYTVEPNVLASYNVSKSIVLATRFFKEELPEFEPSIKQKIVELFLDFYESIKESDYLKRKGTTSLEVINILLSLEDMGIDYLLPEAVVEGIFSLEKADYIELMSCLYYIKDHSEYNKLRLEIEKVIATKISDLSNLSNNARDIYLFLDCVSCPYLSEKFRKELLYSLNETLKISLISNKNEKKLLSYCITNPWFINWKNIDLLSLLEKKQLSAPY